MVAALGLLAFAVAGAAATAFTPLGTLLRRMLAGDRAVVSTPAAPVGSLEVEIPPGGLTVEVAEATAAFRVSIVTWHQALLMLVPTDPEAGVGFRSGPARVTVIGGSSGGVELRVPTDGAVVRVVSEGLTVAVVREGVVRTAGGEAAGSLDASLGTLLAAARGQSP